MTSITVHIRENITIEYHDEHRLYMVVARDITTNEKVFMLNMSDDLVLVNAELAFEGLEAIKITNINDTIEEMNNMEGVELDT